MVIIFSTEVYARFCQALEKQSLRALRRFHEYEKRLESGQGLGELYQLLGKILLDDGDIYGIEDKAMAFEIVACECIANRWVEETGSKHDMVLIVGPVDKVRLYRQLAATDINPVKQQAFGEVLAQRYKKQWDWIRRSALLKAELDEDRPKLDERWFNAFLKTLDACEPLPQDESVGFDSLKKESEDLAASLVQKDADLADLKHDLEFAEDRATRAHRRLRQEEQQIEDLQRQLRLERENGEKLRQERSRRIKLDRQAGEAQKELDRVRLEYTKMDKRMRQMAQRLAAAEQQRRLELSRSEHRVDLQGLRSLSAEAILGVDVGEEAQAISQTRRRFAAVFHSDRVNQLPSWVQALFDEVLGVVNEACDRLKT